MFSCTTIDSAIAPPDAGNECSDQHIVAIGDRFGSSTNST